MDGITSGSSSNNSLSQHEDTVVLPPATKRGKGSCPGPDCEYSYACRKKPSTCPKCGYYLGGSASESAKEDTSVCFATKLKVGDLSENYELYSVKISRRGRDYRCFVQVSTVNNLHICYYEKCRVQRSATIISNSDSFLCEHVKTAKESTVESEIMPVSQTALPALPFPSSMKEELREYLEKAAAKNTPPIQHVSVNNYVLVCEQSHRNPLGLLHLRVDDKKNKFSCGVDGSRTATKPYRSKCVHYCLYGWATLNTQQPTLTPTIVTETQSTSYCGTQQSFDNELVLPVSTQTNKTIQRNSTVELLKKTVKIPEDTIALQPIFKLIESRNAATTTLLDIMRSGKRIELHFNELAWKTSFEPEERHCSLCLSELSEPLNVQGSNGEGWLVTMTHILPITCKVKKCTNSSCMAIHSYHDVQTGLFNIANKILVSIDILFLIREHVKQGVLPSHAVEAIMSMTLAKSPTAALKICGEKRRYIEQHLFKGYWAYECLTVRNYDDAICGLCGVAPKLEVGESSHREAMLLSGVKIDWSPRQLENAVDVDSFWTEMENKSLEQVAFASVAPIIHYEGTKIAPFIPPAHRANTVVNTEQLKVSAKQTQNDFQGNTSKFASLIQRGVIAPLNLNQYSHNDLFSLCQRCDVPVNETDTKATLESYLESGYNLLMSGRSSCHSFNTGSTYNGGKVYKACPHQVVTASKYTVRPESGRDHVDLLKSSKYWPPVYLTDVACTVAQHADVRYPELTRQLWDNRQGCFEMPSLYEDPQPTSCPDLQMTELQSSPTLLLDSDDTHIHPTTGIKERRILSARFFDKTFPHQLKSCEYHNIDLCPELAPYKGCIVQPRHGQRGKDIKRKSTASLSFHHYFLYGRLQDYFSNLATVKQQLELISKQCNEGQTIVRDKFQRFVIVCSKCYYSGHVAKSCPYNT